VDQVIERANDHFRKGKLDIEDNKREQARDEFDKAVDEILMSGLDVRASQRLQTFYLELVEKIYREEVALIPPVQRSERIKNPLTLQDLYVPKVEPVRIDPQLFKLCKTELLDQANVRGLRLRMTLAEAKSLIPSLQVPTPSAIGLSEVTLYAPFRVSSMKGLLGITLSFFESKLFRITARYDNVKSWDSPEQFILHIAKTFNLPQVWEDLPSMRSYNSEGLLKRLECRDSDIVAGIYVSAYGTKYPLVILTDTGAVGAFQQRTQKRINELAEEIERLRAQDRQKFKP
jgi:hypothetical protein